MDADHPHFDPRVSPGKLYNNKDGFYSRRCTQKNSVTFQKDSVFISIPST